MKVEALIDTWKNSLCHANANYQMIALETIAKYNGGASLDVVQQALSLANPTRSVKFFNKNHRVFEVLQKKGMIKAKQQKDELVYVLNISKPTKEDRMLIIKAAKQAKKAYEVLHK